MSSENILWFTINRLDSYLLHPVTRSKLHSVHSELTKIVLKFLSSNLSSMFRCYEWVSCVLAVSSSVYIARFVSLIVSLSAVLLPYFYRTITDALCKYRAQRVALHGADKKQQGVWIGTVCRHVAWGDITIRRGWPPTRSCLSLPTEPSRHFAARGERGYCTNSWSSVTSRVMKEMRSICCQLLD